MVVVFVSILFSFVLCLVFGNDFLSNIMNCFAEAGSKIFTSEKNKMIVVARIISIVLFVCLTVSFIYQSEIGITEYINKVVRLFK